LIDSGLNIVPSAPSRYATVTINVGANTTPVVLAGAPTSALRFDGGDDYVAFGNSPELQITGDQTIEFWLNPTDFNARRNPIAKAYGGEGTMTIETDGRVNYFYGITGGNSGANGEGYQGFSTVRTLP